MKTKNVIIVSVWSKVLIIFVLLLELVTLYYANPSDWLNAVQSNLFVYFNIALQE